MVGAVTLRDECRRCGEVLTRRHGVECSGAGVMLGAGHPDIDPAIGRSTVIDSVLNRYRNHWPEDTTAFEDVAEAIGKIYTTCRNFKQKDNGFWEDQTVAAHPPVPPPAQPP